VIKSRGVDFRDVESNLRDSFRVLADKKPLGEVREYPGVTVASAGVTFQMFNAAFLSSPVATEAELEQRIELAAVHFQTRGIPWAYWICDGWLAERPRRRARQIFQKRQLHLAVDLPGMVAEDFTPPEDDAPSLKILRVTGGATRDAFCSIGAFCFNVPLTWFREVFDSDNLWNRFAGYVGYCEGEPVSTAATVVSSGVIGLYNVSTLPGHQRRGFGEAVTRYAVARAREEHGISRTILQSTTQGQRLYEKLGYRAVTRVAVYSSI
jgi:ribosomal protein S18 acetylase RimI-like enzyme